MTSNTNAIRLHIHDKRLWSASSSQPPTVVVGDIGTALLSFASVDNVIKITADRQNINLILRLYVKKCEGKLKSLQICSPSGNTNESPEAVLMNMDKWDGWPASLGGWHEFNETDHPAYYLSSRYERGIEHDEVMEGVLKLHPAWRGLSFISHLSTEKCARLIAKILDPRWFIDTDDPDKLIRLEAFLGLTPKIQKMVSSTTQPSITKAKQRQDYDNCKLVMSAWMNGRPVSKDEYEQPYNFLWRVHASEGGGYKADLRVSQLFVSYLRNIWLDTVYQSMHNKGVDKLFIPKYFFKFDEEVRAFESFMNLDRA